MDGVDRFAGPVHEHPPRSHLGPPLRWIQLDAKRLAKQDGLRSAFEPSVAPLVFGEPLDPRGTRRVVVDDVRVPEDEVAEPAYGSGGAECTEGGADVEALARASQPLAPREVDAAYEKDSRDECQQHRPRRPVRLDPERRPEGRAEPAQLRPLPRGTGLPGEQRVFHTDHRRERGDREGENRGEPSDVLPAGDHLRHDPDHGDHEVADELETEERHGVEA